MSKETDKTALSFGRYLQSIRIDRGISLETVSKETRIRLETLQQIEEEDHEQLPDEVFVKGFLRAYAKVIDADGDEAVKRYLSRLQVIQKIITSETHLHRSESKFWLRLLFCLAGLFALIAATLVGVSMMRNRTVMTLPSEIEQPSEVNPPDTNPVAAPPPKNEAVEPQQASSPEKLLLKIETVEDTWLKIIIDDQEPNEYTLYPGDLIELEAVSGFNILVGNATGVKITLNDKMVNVTGKSGEVVNIQLP